MDVDSIPVGRELDAAVAEHVIYRGQWTNACGSSTIVAPYSTDIAAAWEVVEADPSKDWIIERIHGEWSVRQYAGMMCWWAQTNTFPEAICRAALKAVTRA